VVPSRQGWHHSPHRQEWRASSRSGRRPPRRPGVGQAISSDSALASRSGCIPLAGTKAWEMPIERHLERMVVGCPSCMAAKGVVDPVARWMPFYVRVCTVHKTWLHADDRDLLDSRQSPHSIRLRGLPEMITAQRRLTNLTRRRDDELLRVAYVEAFGVVLRWAAQDRKDCDRWRRLDLLMGADSRWRVKPGDPALDAVLFPEVVSLVGVFSSPYWRQLAGADDGSKEQLKLLSIVHEHVGLADAREHPSRGPFRQWIRAQQIGAPPVSWLADETRFPRWPEKEPDYDGFAPNENFPVPKRVHANGRSISVAEVSQPRLGFRLIQLADTFSFTCCFCRMPVHSKWIAVRNSAKLQLHDAACDSCYSYLTGVHAPSPNPD
jgi:hypothetical protein